MDGRRGLVVAVVGRRPRSGALSGAPRVCQDGGKTLEGPAVDGVRRPAWWAAVCLVCRV